MRLHHRRRASGGVRPALAVLTAAALFTSARPQSDGDVYVANLRSGEITVYDGTSGSFRRVLVRAGVGGLRGPTGLAIGPSGDLFVSSSQTNQILRFDASTGATRGVFVDDTALAAPYSVIFGPDGDLYVSAGRGNVVRRYEGRSGRFLNLAASDSALRQPIGLAFGPDRLLYVANSASKNVMRFDPATGKGRVLVVDSLRFPSDVAFGPDGALYVSDASRRMVIRFDPRSGAFRDVYTTLPSGAAPVGLAFARDGRLFVGDFGGSRLYLVPAGGGEAHLVSDERLAGPENVIVRMR